MELDAVVDSVHLPSDSIPAPASFSTRAEPVPTYGSPKQFGFLACAGTALPFGRAEGVPEYSAETLDDLPTADLGGGALRGVPNVVWGSCAKFNLFMCFDDACASWSAMLGRLGGVRPQAGSTAGA